jgi:ArsR family transcriptional regulator
MGGSVYDDDTVSSVARALAHPARVRILRLLAAQAECCGSEIFSDIPLAQSTVSEHIRVLKDAGLVCSHPVGTGMVYCISSDKLDPLQEYVEALKQDSPACIPSEGEDTGD